MYEILIFGGTSEGRELAEYCSEKNIYCMVSVTTSYASELLPKNKFVKIIQGKAESSDMSLFIVRNEIKTVIDATHPYALQATENIKKACLETSTPYIRLKRESSETYGKIFNNLSEMCGYLNLNDKIILNTLGSKELHELTKVNNFRNRIFSRLLPVNNIIGYCESLGFDKNKLILEKPPFSLQQNIMHINMTRAEILITKESGKNGGYPEKVQAVKQCGTEILTLKRPEENGMDLTEIKNILIKTKEK